MKIYFILSLVFFLSCATSKNNKKSTTEIDLITFGSGGGFTGEITTYTLLLDGIVLEGKNQINQIDPKQALLLYHKAEKWKNYSYDQPQNMYFFLEIKTAEKTNHIVWGYGSKKANPEILNFYIELMGLVKIKT